MATYPDSTACWPSSRRRRRWSRPPRGARRPGYTRMDAYSPFPIEELAEALGFRRTKLPLLILLRRDHRRAVRRTPCSITVPSSATRSTSAAGR